MPPFMVSAILYSTIQISAYDTPNLTGEKVPHEVARQLVSRQWVEDHLKKWGESSPLAQVRIRAEFPSQADDT